MLSMSYVKQPSCLMRFDVQVTVWLLESTLTSVYDGRRHPSTLVKVIVPMALIQLVFSRAFSAELLLSLSLPRLLPSQIHDFASVHSEFCGGPPGLFLQPVQVPLDCSSALEYIDHHQSGGTCKPDDLCGVPPVCGCQVEKDPFTITLTWTIQPTFFSPSSCPCIHTVMSSLLQTEMRHGKSPSGLFPCVL